MLGGVWRDPRKIPLVYKISWGRGLLSQRWSGVRFWSVLWEGEGKYSLLLPDLGPKLDGLDQGGLIWPSSGWWVGPLDIPMHHGVLFITFLFHGFFL